jgi:hypothetical protein
VNRYRLANVLFSESVRDVVLNRRQPLTKKDLDKRLTLDQTFHENIAREYNTSGLHQYDALQFPQFQFTILPTNLPDNFTEIHWTDVKKVWRECVKEVERAISEKNMSGKNDPSDEDEEALERIGSFTKHAYVEYWFCYAEQYPQLFKSMNTPLPEGAFNESSSPETSSSGVFKKRMASDIYLQMQKKHLHIQQTIVSQQHEHHGRIIAIQAKNLATQADNQKSQQYGYGLRSMLRFLTSIMPVLTSCSKRRTLASMSVLETRIFSDLDADSIVASRMPSIDFQQLHYDVEARVRLLEQDVKTGMIDVKNLSMERSP